MNKNPVIFRDVRLEKLYGRSFEGIKITDLVQGINVVFGPNAAGKSTIARILQHAIWPSSMPGQRPSYAAHFDLNDQKWAVRSKDGIVTRHNGVANADPGGLPGADDRKHYYLHLHDLIQSEGEEFAEKIVREMAGGYDVKSAARNLGFKEGLPRQSKLTKQLTGARKELQRIRNERKSLLLSEKSLETLEVSLQEARSVALRKSFFEKLKAFLEANEAENQARNILSEYPEALKNATGTEHEDLRILENELENLNSSIEGCERRIRSLSEQVGSSIFDRVTVNDTFFEELRLSIDALKNAEKEYQNAQEAEETAKRVERNLLQAIDPEADPDKLDQLRVGNLDTLAQLCKEYEDREQKISQLEAAQSIFFADEPAVDLDVLREGTRQLEIWLSHDRKGASDSFSNFSTAFIVIAFALTVASILGWLYWQTGQLTLLVPAFLFFYFFFLIRSWRSSKPQREAQKGFERTKLDAPIDWTIDSVRLAHRELEIKLGQATVAFEKRKVWSEATKNLEKLEKDNQILEHRLGDYAESLGATAEMFPSSMLYFSERVKQFQLARAESVKAVSNLHKKQEIYERRLEDVNKLFGDVETDPVESIVKAESIRVALQKQFSEWETNRKDLTRERDDLLRYKAEAKKKEQGIFEIYRRLNVEPKDEIQVVQLCSKFDDYTRARNDLDQKSAVLRNATQALEGDSHFETRWKELTLEEVGEQLQRAEEAGIEASELTRRIAGIEKELEVARKRNDLEAATTEVHRAEDSLRQEREKAIEMAAGWELTRFLIQDTVERQLPIVFQRARQYFRDITAHRYDLLMDRDNVAFSAVDTSNDQLLSLEQLSSGTRIQLLIAVRLAFVEQQETQVRLPLILDETLANSDSDRSKAIMDALKSIARTGRQIFYFTAREDEVAKWNALSEESDVCPIKLIGLSGTINLDSIHEEALPPVVNNGLKLAKDRVYTHEELGEILDVPVWTAQLPTGMLSIWYLISDPKAIIRFTEAGFVNWGQLKGLQHRTATLISGLSEQEFGEVITLGRAVESWKQLWNRGRGIPVDRQALEDSNAVSDTFLENVLQLSDSLGSSAEFLIDRLRAGDVKGFRSNKIDLLEAYFVANGYLSDEETLSDVEITTYLLNQIAPGLQESGLAADDVLRVIGRIVDRAKR